MTRQFFIFIFLIFCLVSSGQTTDTSKTFYLKYSFAGLGSNMATLQTTLRIKGSTYILTRVQNSYYGQPILKPDSISKGTLRLTSIDSIINIIKPLKDTTIFESNPCMRSGGIHFITISNGKDTVKYELMNTITWPILKICNILNSYLPSDNQIWATEELIKNTENCRAHLRKLSDDKKKKSEK